MRTRSAARPALMPVPSDPGSAALVPSAARARPPLPFPCPPSICVGARSLRPGTAERKDVVIGSLTLIHVVTEMNALVFGPFSSRISSRLRLGHTKLRPARRAHLSRCRSVFGAHLDIFCTASERQNSLPDLFSRWDLVARDCCGVHRGLEPRYSNTPTMDGPRRGG
jgi:hypothetical protein